MKKKIIYAFFILLYHVFLFYVYSVFSLSLFVSINDIDEDFIYSRDRNDFPPYYNIYEMKTVSSGNHIINALEDYCLSNEKYPDKLEWLVPTYIKKIPKTAYRRLFIGFYIPFDYHYYEKENVFILSCKYHIFSELYYNSREKKWKYANH